MNIFDIIGPVMVGPSSSHTAGVVRIGNVARRVLGADPKRALIKFHGSFASTYRGHGSDRAVIAGLLGFGTNDGRIRDSLELAAENGMEYSFETVDIPGAHPNTLMIEAETSDGAALRLTGVSTGGGNILVTQINGVSVHFDGKFTTLLVDHRDVPGVISVVANVLTVEGINIAGMNVSRARKHGTATMTIMVDGEPDAGVKLSLESLPYVTHVTLISKD